MKHNFVYCEIEGVSKNSELKSDENELREIYRELYYIY